METVRAAYGSLWWRRDDVLRLAVVPAIVAFAYNSVLAVMFDLEAVADPLDPPPVSLWFLPLSLLLLLPAALFATNWMRVLLFGSGAVPGLGLNWERRTTKLLLRWIQISLAAVAAVIPIVVGMLVLGLIWHFGVEIHAAPSTSSPSMFVPLLSAAIGVVVYLYVQLRLSLALPATAEDETRVIGLSWTLTRGSTLRFFAAVFSVLAPFYLLIFGSQFVLARSGLNALIPFSGALVVTILGYAGLAAGSSVLVAAYVRLGKLHRQTV